MRPVNSWLMLVACVAVSSFLITAPMHGQESSRRVQDDDNNSQRSELGERQRFVERKMLELEDKFIVIAQKLQEKEPERAQRLIAAYQQAKEKLIVKEMAAVSNLLDKRKLTEADEKLNVVIENLSELFRLLMNEKTETASKKKEIENLEKWKQAIQSLQKEQKQQTRETNKVANKDETLNKLEAQIKQLDKLIQTQKSIAEQTQGSGGATIRELDRLADKQFDVRKKTEELAKEIASGDAPKSPPKAADGPAGEGGDSKSDDPKSGDQEKDENNSDESKPGDSKPGDSKPGDSKPGDSKPGDSKPGDSKPGDSKPGDSKSGDSKSGDSKSGDSKPGDSKPGDSKSGQQPPQPGQKPLEQASENQRRSEEKLGSGKTKDAKRQQDQAIKEMEKAMTELQKEQRRIASLPPEAFQQMAEKQRRTRDKALDIAKQMEKEPKGEPNTDEQNANQQSPAQQPGQQQMQNASDSMKNASKDLDNQQAQNAERKQKKAEEDLKKALEEIEERLNQLREETRAEKLARLEGRFREMLDRQQIVSIETIELDDRVVNLKRLKRRDHLMLLQMANEEMEIQELGNQAYDLLLEDGTSDVFPEVVHGLGEDLQRVSSFLESERTDQLTQLLQKNIEGTLEELLEALKDAQKSGGGGGGGQGGGKQPLLKKSHEYKILKYRQLRINRRTRQLDRIRNEQDRQQHAGDEDLEKEIENTAEEQAKLLELTEDIMDDQ